MVSGSPDRSATGCAVVGGGPAGMMLGFLLARAGVEVVVFEKHADFLRDFRGDTIHPSTMNILDELGLLDEFLKRPHSETRQLEARIANAQLTLADFSHLPSRAKFLAFMPQWDFLDFIAEHAKRCPQFQLRMKSEVTDLIYQHGRVVGVRGTSDTGPFEVRAELVVGTDGRSSIVRERAGLIVDDFGAPMDVLWMRVSRQEGDPPQTLGRVDFGRIFIMLQREGYWQCGMVIPKGRFDQIRAAGIEAFRADVGQQAPWLEGRVEELQSWDDVKLLTVKVDRLRRWYQRNVLCIGDAAHAMSPIAGVGINLAIQDAVAAANILAQPLREGYVSIGHLREVQRRREFAARATQRLQLLVQNRFVSTVLNSGRPPDVPLFAKLLDYYPTLRRLPAYIVGVGIRPEHIRAPVARS